MNDDDDVGGREGLCFHLFWFDLLSFAMQSLFALPTKWVIGSVSLPVKTPVTSRRNPHKT